MCYEMMCSKWIVSRAASEGGVGGGKVWGRQKKCGDDEEEEEERKKEAKSLLHVRMCTTLLFLCTVFAPCVVFPHLCVVLCWCDILFYVLCVFVLCAALYFLTFFLSCSLCVHHTWVKQPSWTQPKASFIPRMCRRIVVCHSGKHKLHQSEMN